LQDMLDMLAMDYWDKTVRAYIGYFPHDLIS
jgi:hypothetical protein